MVHQVLGAHMSASASHALDKSEEARVVTGRDGHKESMEVW